ncbi:MAG: glycosyltransferase [Gemmatimonadaceae bacterium]
MTAALWPAWLASGLWILWLVVIVVRFFGSRRLDEYPAAAPADAPLVSVVIPARNEAHNIERCLRSVLATTYPAVEVFVVDDHSTDGTGAIARRIAAEDPGRRVRVLDAPPLPNEWFGKQWACHTAAMQARGTLLCFTDADTTHGADLLARSVNALRARDAALFSVVGRQEMVTFWEKVVQPFVFAILMSHTGNLEAMSRSLKPRRKFANGQFLLMRRDAYDQVGGHEGVRQHVAEDLMLAQRLARQGLAAHMVLGRDAMSTRMYRSLGEIRRGWGKNVYAAGRDVLPVGPVTSRILPFIFPLPALVSLVPTVALILGLTGVAGAATLWFGIVSSAAYLVFWVGTYHYARLNPLWALSHPLGALVFAWILAEAAWRGSRVSWKGRAYVSRSG